MKRWQVIVAAICASIAINACVSKGDFEKVTDCKACYRPIDTADSFR